MRLNTLISGKMKDAGFHISLFGVAIILIWIGLFKFTPTEAKAIVPLVEHSPLMSWMYLLFDVQVVSNIIGALEVLTGLLLLGYYWSPYSGLIGGVMASFTFIATLSFIFTTPKAIDYIDGFLLPDAFILKDIMALGISVSIALRSYFEIFKPS